MSEYNVTRTEKLLSSVASGNPSGIDPITREEMFLSYIAGESDTKPKPITRKEKLLDKIGVSGAGGDAKPEQEKTVDITENGTTEIVPDEGNTLSKVTVNTSVVDGEPGKPYIDTSRITIFSSFGMNDRLNGSIGLLDTSKGTQFSSMFFNSQKLTTVPYIDTSNGKDFESMFRSCYMLNTIARLDFSNGVKFPQMFENCYSIVDLSHLFIPAATAMSSLFKNCYKLEKLPSQFSTENAETIYGLFQDCRAIKNLPFLDVAKCTNFNYTFSGCTSLESVSFSTSKKDFATSTFQNCTALTNITIGEGWAVSIYLHYSNNLTVESLHGMIENLADLTGRTAKTFQVGETNLAKIDEDHMAMLEAKNWNYS